MNAPTAAPLFPKQCACGRSFSEAEFVALPFVGHQESASAPVQELRNCPCGSTLAVEVPGTGSPRFEARRAVLLDVARGLCSVADAEDRLDDLEAE